MGNRCSNLKSFQSNRTNNYTLLDIVIWIVTIGNPDLAYEFKIHPSIDRYIAFPGVEDSKLIAKLNTRELINIGGGIKISKPVIYNKIRGKFGDDILASISHRGIFASYFSCNYRGHILFTDLITGEKSKMIVENWTLVGFYDDKAIFITSGVCLREIKASELFNQKDTSNLKQMNNVKSGNPFTDVTKLNTTRKLFYINPKHITYLYDVDKKETRRFLNNMKVCSFVNMTGIGIDRSLVLCEYEYKFKKYLIKYSRGNYKGNTCQDKINEVSDENTTAIEIKHCHFMPVAPIFIQSSSDPNNISKCLRVSWKSIDFMSKHIKMKKLKSLQPVGFISIIRLYKDMFIMYNGKTARWDIIRIIVP